MPLVINGEINESSLQDLISNQVLEDIELEYKNYDYPEGQFKDQKNKNDLMIGIAAFANTNGGYMILGIKENNNVPIELEGVGFSSEQFGEWEKSFENIILALIKPKIHGIKCHKIETSNQKVLIAIQIPKSFSRPHAVCLNGKHELYMRKATGKYPMDIDDMRKQFLRADSFHQQMQGFLRERIALILSDEYPVELAKKPNFVLHFIPEWSFELGNNIDLPLFINENKFDLSKFLGNMVNDWGFNADGCYLKGINNNGYVQIFRNGIAEFNFLYLFQPDNEIWWHRCQFMLIQDILFYEKLIDSLIPKPYYCKITLLNAKGYCDSLSNATHSKMPEHAISNNMIHSQIGVWEDKRPLLQVLKPIFDSLSNALNYEKSFELESILNKEEKYIKI